MLGTQTSCGGGIQLRRLVETGLAHTVTGMSLDDLFNDSTPEPDPVLNKQPLTPPDANNHDKQRSNRLTPFNPASSEDHSFKHRESFDVPTPTPATTTNDLSKNFDGVTKSEETTSAGSDDNQHSPASRVPDDIKGSGGHVLGNQRNSSGVTQPQNNTPSNSSDSPNTNSYTPAPEAGMFPSTEPGVDSNSLENRAESDRFGRAGLSDFAKTAAGAALERVVPASRFIPGSLKQKLVDRPTKTMTDDPKNRPVGKNQSQQVGFRLQTGSGMVVVAVGLVMLILFTVIGGASDDDTSAGMQPPDEILAVAENPFLAHNALKAYQVAAIGYDDERYGGVVPWSLLAAIGAFGSEHGRVSPYPLDKCDRAANRGEFMKPRFDVGPEYCEGQISTDPVVLPPIGDEGLNQGIGPMLLSPQAALELSPNRSQALAMANTLSGSGAWGQIESGLDFLAFEMARLRRDLVDSGEYSPELTEEDTLALWTAVVAQLPIRDPFLTECPTPIPANDSSSIALAIITTWHCELSNARQLYTLALNDEQNVADDELLVQLPISDAIETILGEAHTVAWAFSSLGTNSWVDPQRCETAVEDPDNPDSPTPKPELLVDGSVPVGVFPLTEDVYEAFTPKPDVNRCDLGANIHAAVKAFIAGESVKPGSIEPSNGYGLANAPALGDRRVQPGEPLWAMMYGGWQAMSWVLGHESLGTLGPYRPFEPNTVCDQHVLEWVTQTVNNQKGLVTEVLNGEKPGSSLLGGVPQLHQLCGNVTDGTMEDLAAMFARQLASGVTKSIEADPDASDPGSEEDGSSDILLETDPQTNNPGVPHYDSPVPGVWPPPGVTGQEPQVESLVVTNPVFTSLLVTENEPDNHPDVAWWPEELPPYLEDVSVDDVFLFYGYHALADALLETVTDEGVLAPAQTPKDSAVLRLSVSGRKVANVPPMPARPTSYADRVVNLAIGIAGLYEGDPRWDPTVNPLAGGFGGGFSGMADSALLQMLFPAMPQVLADAIISAANTCNSDPEYNGAWIDPLLLAVIAQKESGAFWKNITETGYLDTKNSNSTATGVFQFLVGTWDSLVRVLGVAALDGNGDGVAERENVYDAALGTCRSWARNIIGENTSDPDVARKAITIHVFGVVDSRVPAVQTRLVGQMRNSGFSDSMINAHLSYPDTALEALAALRAQAAILSPVGLGSHNATGEIGALLDYALSKLRMRYHMDSVGRMKPDTFDCSSFTGRSYWTIGRSLGSATVPFTAEAQFNYMNRMGLGVPQTQMQPGDLIFYAGTGSRSCSICHVSIYIGNNQIVHARNPSKGVTLDSADYNQKGIRGVARPIMLPRDMEPKFT